MFKLNFEFDSNDPVSSRFFDWLSAFPLEKSAVKITTSVDYVDPSSNSSNCHRVGNIIFEFTPDHEISISNIPEKNDDAKALSEPTHTPSGIIQNESDYLASQITSDNLSDFSDKQVSPDLNDHSDEIVSAEVKFESDIDESLMAAVAFGNDDENIKQEDESSQHKGNLKNESDDISNTNDFSNMKEIQETENDVELDFLLDSLDEFNN